MVKVEKEQFLIHSVTNTNSYKGTLKTRQEEIEKNISNDLLELLMQLCSTIMQQYTVQFHRDSSTTLPLSPDQHHISEVALRRLGGQ